MTPTEIRDRCKAMAKDVGPHALVTVSVNVKSYDPKEPLSASLYAYWPARYEADVSVNGDDWETLFAELGAKWTAFQSEYRTRVTRDMALEIIRMTAERGQCTDSNLRAKFRPEDVAQFGESACIVANGMAANGPFVITATTGANAQGAEANPLHRVAV
jgi:hypothetical protein